VTDLAGYYDESYPPSLWGGGTPGVPDPHIDTLAPSSGSAAAGPITITVTGSNFEAGSVVEVDQAPVTTAFVSATSLTATYDPSTTGTKLFTVRNPNEEESNSVPFTVAAEAEEEQQVEQTETDGEDYSS
jgi:hypothetical protein